MATVQDLAHYVRSKSAGPFWVTLEIFCSDDPSYEAIKNSPNITKEKVAELYGLDENLVNEFIMDNIRVIKYSFPRPHPAGWIYENDMHYGQQYIPLADRIV